MTNGLGMPMSIDKLIESEKIQGAVIAAIIFITVFICSHYIVEYYDQEYRRWHDFEMKGILK